MNNDFGFTNDINRLNAAKAFRDAAIADGWVPKQTYPGGEPMESAASLERDGYKLMIFTRDKPTPNGKWKYQAEVNLWGPDRFAIKPPDVYDFVAITKNIRNCHYCKAADVETTRVGFAGRACTRCAPIEEAKLGSHYYD